MLAFPETEPVETLDIEQKSLLRFITCGSVDDGKSTLIGRLLHECGAVFEDQLDTLEKDSKKFGTTGEEIDFALLVDGLSAEREQGITIDVAYRYFSTARRAFIVADTPGHEQYTRNMATAASTVDLAVLLVDARKGLLVQTRRHAFIASLMQVSHVILAINKMDLVDYDETVFRKIEQDFRSVATDLGFESVTAIPLNARGGDNVVKPSTAMPWYSGQTLLSCLETSDVAIQNEQQRAFSFPVQWVNRPDDTFRGFSGTVAAGGIKAGEDIAVLAGGRTSKVSRIVTADGDINAAVAGQAVTLVLADEIDASRGDVFTKPFSSGAASGSRGNASKGRQAQHQSHDVTRSQKAIARLFWTGQNPGHAMENYVIKLASDETQVRIQKIHHGLDMKTFSPVAIGQIETNAVALVVLTFTKPLAIADYARNKVFGSLLLIDRFSNETVAIGLIDQSAEIAEVSANQSERPAGLAHYRARLNLWLDRRIGTAKSQQRTAYLQRACWWIVSPVLVAVIVGVVSGRLWLAIAAGFADLVLRPLVRRMYDRIWERLTDRGNDYGDGGGI